MPVLASDTGSVVFDNRYAVDYAVWFQFVLNVLDVGYWNYCRWFYMISDDITYQILPHILRMMLGLRTHGIWFLKSHQVMGILIAHPHKNPLQGLGEALLGDNDL